MGPRGPGPRGPGPRGPNGMAADAVYAVGPDSLCLAWDHYHVPHEEPGNSIARAEVLATISLLPERGVPVLGIANMQHHIIIE